MDWSAITEKLTTESICSYLSSYDPVSLISDPYVIIPSIIVLCVLCFMKMVRTLAVLLGLFAMWVAMVYSFPEENQELQVKDITIFGSVAIGVAICWIYVFIIRSDN